MNVCGLQWDTTGSLPFQPELQAFYVNGRFATRPIQYRKGAVWIDVLGDAPHAARWLDVENEDAKPSQVPGWLDQRGSDGGIYCSRNILQDVITAADGRKFDLWVATLDGTIFPYELNNLPSNVKCVAVQAFSSAFLKINADLSVVLDQEYWNAHKI